MKLNFSLLSIFILFQIVKCQDRSLIFVTDITKSMMEDIEQVREVCNDILDFSGTEKKIISNYVLSMFRDPVLEPVISTKNPQKIRDALSDIKTEEGGDCPENSISGIKASLDHAHPNSIMFVFTDATANDYYLAEEVLKTLRAKQISVSFIITPATAPKCLKQDPLTGPGYEVYEKIAEQTNGLVLKMEKSEIKDVISKLTDWFNPNYEIFDITEYSKPTSVKNEIFVSNMKKLIITSTGDGELSIIGPNKKIYKAVVTGTTRQIIVLDPPAGKWIVSAKSKKAFTLQRSGISETTFQYGFSSKNVLTIDDTETQPLNDAANYLNIFVSKPSAIKTLKYVKFVPQDGKEIQISLKKLNSAVYFAGPIDIPKTVFKISLFGVDKFGHDLHVLLSKAVAIEDPEKINSISQEFEVLKMKTVIFTSTGDREFSATDPNDIVHESEYFNGTIKQIIVNNPTSGKWKVTASSTNKVEVFMSGELMVTTYEFGFSSTKVTSQDETQSQPLEGKRNYFQVFVSDPDGVKILKHIKMILKDGSESKVNLKKVDDDLYRAGPINIPQSLSKISVHGVDESNSEINKVIYPVTNTKKFEYGFSSVPVTSQDDTRLMPDEYSKNYLSVFVSDPDNLKTLRDIKLTSIDGSIHKVVLKKVNNNLYTTPEPIDIPIDLSKISVHGVDILNQEINELVSDKDLASKITDESSIKSATEKEMEVKNIESFIITSTGNDEFKVIDPDGVEYKSVKNGTSKQIFVPNPKEGKWLVSTKCTTPFKLQLSGTKKKTITYGFSSKPGTSKEESKSKPIPNTKNYLKFFTSNEDNVKTIKQVVFTGNNGRKFKYLVTKAGNNEYTTGLIDIPTDIKDVSVTKVDESNEETETEISVLGSPEDAELKFDQPKPSAIKKTITVNKEMKKLVITSTGNGKLVLTGPDNIERKATTKGNTKQIIVDYPITGEWKISADTTKSTEIKSSGVSEVTFDYGFSSKPVTHKRDTKLQPLEGTKNYFSVFISDADDIKTIKHVTFTPKVGKKIQVALRKVADDVYRTDIPIDIPKDISNISVLQVDKSNTETKIVVPDTVVISDPDIVETEYSSESTIETRDIMVDKSMKTLIITSNDGILKLIDPYNKVHEATGFPKKITVNNPTTGKYKIFANTKEPVKLKVTEISEPKIEFGFSLNSVTTKEETQKVPFKDSKNSFNVFLRNSDKLRTVNHVTFITEGGKKTIAMKEVTKGVYTSGLIDIPKNILEVSVGGEDDSEDEIEVVLPKIDTDPEPELVKKFNSKKTITINQNMKKLVITSTGNGKLIAIDSKKVEYKPTLVGNTNQIIVNYPTKGEWKIIGDSPEPFDVKQSGVNEVTYESGFSSSPVTKKEETESKPFIGSKNYFNVFVSDTAADLKTVKHVTFTTRSGKKIQATLTKVADNVYSTGSIDIPKHISKISVLQVDNLNTETEVLVPNTVIIPDPELVKTEHYSEPFSVTKEILVENTKNLVITSTGDGVFKVIDPNNKVHTAVLIGTVKQFNILNPIKGKWKVLVDSAKPFDVQVTEKNKVDLELGYSSKLVTRKSDTQLEPLEYVENQLNVFVSDSSIVKTIDKIVITGKDGTITKFDMIKVKKGVYTTGPIELPIDRSHISVDGIDESNAKVEVVLPKVDADPEPEFVEAKPTTIKQTITVNTMEKLIITSTGNGKLVATDPDNVEHKATTVGNTQQISVEHPITGKWKITGDSTKPFEIQSYRDSEVTFNYGFSSKPVTHQKYTQLQPFEDSVNYFNIFVSDADDLKILNHVVFIQKDGKKIQVTLKKVNKNVYTTESIDAPKAVSQIIVDGENISNEKFNVLVPNKVIIPDPELVETEYLSQPSKVKKEFMVNKNTNKLIITSNGDGVLKITGPDNVIHDSVVTGTTKQIILKNPMTGKWVIYGSSTDSFTMKVSEKTRPKLELGFSVDSVKSIKDTEKIPLKGVKNHINVFVSDKDFIKNCSLVIILKDGTKNKIALTKVIKGNKPIYKTGLIDIPNDILQLSVDGVDEKNDETEVLLNVERDPESEPVEINSSKIKKEVMVTKEMKKLIITSTGNGKLIVTGPDSTIYKSYTVGNIRKIIVNYPIKGKYLISADSTKPFDIEHSGESKMTFEYGFSSKEVTTIANTRLKPSKFFNNFNVFVRNPDNLKNVKHVVFIQPDGKEIKFALKYVEQGVYTTGPIDVPEDTSKVSVVGKNTKEEIVSILMPNTILIPDSESVEREYYSEPSTIDKEILVNKNMENLIITSNGNGVLRVTGPNKIVYEAVRNGLTNQINILNPGKGKWVVSDSSTESFTTHVSEKSKVNLDFGFSSDSGSAKEDTQKVPLEGVKNYLKVFVNNPIACKNKKLNDVVITGKDGKKTKIALLKVNDETYITGPIDISTDVSHVSVNGVNESGGETEELLPMADDMVLDLETVETKSITIKKEFKVNKMEKLIITSTGDGKLIATDPNDIVYKPTGSIKQIVVQRPTIGKWVILGKSTGTFEIHSSGESKVTFDYGFSSTPVTKKIQTESTPNNYVKNYVNIFVSNVDDLKTLKYVTLTTKSGKQIQVALKKVNKNVYRTEELINIPKDVSRISVLHVDNLNIETNVMVPNTVLIPDPELVKTEYYSKPSRVRREIIVDKIKTLIITSNGDGLLKVTDPNNKVHDSVDTKFSKKVTVNNPSTGKWIISASSTDLFVIEVTEISGQELEFGYSVDSVTAIKDTKSVPLKGSKNNLNFFVSATSGLSKLDQLTITTKDGKKTQIVLKEVANGHYETGLIDIPTDILQLSVDGVDNFNKPTKVLIPKGETSPDSESVKTKSSTIEKSIMVNKNLKKLIIKSTGVGKLIATDSKNKKYESITSGTGKQITVDIPTPGEWIISGDSAEQFEIEVFGMSDVILDHGFSSKPVTQKEETQMQPFEYKENYFNVFISNPDNLKVLKHVIFIQPNGKEMQVALTKVNERFYRTELIDLTKDISKILVVGEDKLNVETYVSMVPSSVIIPNTESVKTEYHSEPSRIKRELMVSKNIKNLIITSNGNGDFKVTDPNHKVYDSVDTDFTKQISILNPISGKWVITASSTESFIVHVSEIKEMNYDIRFSPEPATTVEATQKTPLKYSKNYISVFVKNPIYSPTLKIVVAGKNGTKNTIELKKESDNKYTTLLPIDISPDATYVFVDEVTKSNTTTEILVPIVDRTDPKPELDKTKSRSLVFVMDVTSSMKSEADQLRQVSGKLLDKFYGAGDFANYVLTMFRDPEIEPVISTTDPQEIKEALNTVKIRGRGDCPDASIGGIRASLQYALPKSIIFVFTDATASDYQLGEEVLKALREKQISVSFIITKPVDNCSSKDKLKGPGYEIYEKIARETNGLVVQINKGDVKKVFEKLKDQFNPNHNIIKIMNYPKPTEVKKVITVNEMKKLTLTFIGEGVFKVYDPNDNVYEPETIGNIQQITELDPTPGNWVVFVSSTTPFTIQAGGIGEVTFDYGFSSTKSKQKRKEKTNFQPTENTKNSLNIYVSNSDAITRLTHAKLILNDGREVTTVLEKVSETCYSTGLIDIPKDQFKISVIGDYKSDRKISTLVSSTVEPIKPEFLKTKPKSLIFVTDVTVSMKGEVNMLREISSKLLDNVHGAGKFVFANYVLSMFRDPDLLPVTNTKNPEELKEVLSTVKITGEGDCPENSIAGIKASLKHALPNSIMFVFTDATAKDHELGEEVLKMLRDKQISVSFLITPPADKCKTKDPLKGPGYEIYQKIARYTNGMILKSDENDLTKVFEKLMYQFNPKYEIIKTDFYPVPKNIEMNLSITKLSKLIVTSTGDGSLSATGPEDKDYSSEDTKNVNQLVIENPMPGDWVFTADSTHPFTVTVAGISDVKFEYGFSNVTVERKNNTYNQPLIGSQNYLTVFTSNPKAVETLENVSFIFDDGKKIKTELKKVNGNVYQSKLIDIPQKPFKILLEGDDESEVKIQRILSKTIEGVNKWDPILPDLEDEDPEEDNDEEDRNEFVNKVPNIEEVMQLLNQMHLPQKLINIFIKNNITVNEIKNSLDDEKLQELTTQYCSAIHCRVKSGIKKYREDSGFYDANESMQCMKTSLSTSAIRKTALTGIERKELEKFMKEKKYSQEIQKIFIENNLSMNYIKSSLTDEVLHVLIKNFKVEEYDKIREDIKKLQ